MARPREFDEHAVLNAAMNRFWEHGYQATSIRDLEVETGLTSPSLYNAFGDKRALFRQVLERYTQYSARARIARLESSMAPKDAIKAFFTEIVEHSLSDKDRRGCLLVNSALEIAPHDPEIGAEVASRLGEVEAFFRRSVVAAQREGRIPSDRGATDLARVLLAVLLGIRVAARARPERKLLEGMARPVLAMLDGPASRLEKSPAAKNPKR
ncbi:MAG: TetR/AcrR family transcriptional regulator [Xanthobacteraceae bacterium]|nr:TetR/AcrR family transcriptional regulator [Xanthobacteraceae bacterium]MBV9631547.1 TetR/AcrR family transcriptional regulator [Xanthobacteraceae bacterium]